MQINVKVETKCHSIVTIYDQQDINALRRMAEIALEAIGTMYKTTVVSNNEHRVYALAHYIRDNVPESSIGPSQKKIVE